MRASVKLQPAGAVKVWGPGPASVILVAPAPKVTLHLPLTVVSSSTSPGTSFQARSSVAGVVALPVGWLGDPVVSVGLEGVGDGAVLVGSDGSAFGAPSSHAASSDIGTTSA